MVMLDSSIITKIYLLLTRFDLTRIFAFIVFFMKKIKKEYLLRFENDDKMSKELYHMIYKI